MSRFHWSTHSLSQKFVRAAGSLLLTAVLSLAGFLPAVSVAAASREEELNEQARQAIISGYDRQEPEITVPKSPELVGDLLREVWKDHPRFWCYVNPGTKEVRARPDGSFVVVPIYDTHLLPVLKQFLKDAPKTGSDFDKEVYVHDKAADLITYQKGKHTLDDAFLRRRADCQAYSRLMCVALDFLGVKCREITGTGGGKSHRWNIVTLNGKEYVTDATWDDLDDGGPAVHRYFNLTRAEIAKNHEANDDRDWKNCRYTDQNYYRKKGLYCTSAAEAAGKLLRSREVQMPSEAAARLTDYAAASLQWPRIYYADTSFGVVVRHP